MRIHLCLGDTFRESMSVSPMDMDVGDDLILGWDWISSLRHLLVAGKVSLRSGLALLLLDLLPAAARPASRTVAAICHSEIRRLLRHITRKTPPDKAAVIGAVVPGPDVVATTAALESQSRSSGWSRPVDADHAELAALEAEHRQAARARRRPGRPPYRRRQDVSPMEWKC